MGISSRLLASALRCSKRENSLLPYARDDKQAKVMKFVVNKNKLRPTVRMVSLRGG